MTDSLLRNAYALHQAGQIVEAGRLYEEILRADPKQCDALYLLGFAHMQRGAFVEALGCYDRLLALRPGSADAYAARGTVLSNLGRHADALQAYEKAIAIKPEHATAWNHRGNALLELNRDEDALQSYDRAVAIQPDYADAWRHRGLASLQLGRSDDALASFDKVLNLEPRDADILAERGHLLMRLGRHADALADYDRALALKPDDADLLYNRGNAHSILKNYAQAISDCAHVLELAPEYPYARGILVHSKLQCCDWKGLDHERIKVAADVARGKRVISPFNYKALSDSPEEQLQCAQAWAANECPSAAPLWRGERYSHDRIRLAYVSADLNNSAVATLMAGVFEGHDRTRFETIAISFGPKTVTPMRTRLEAAFGRFIDVREKSDTEIAAQMRAMEVDIAVDLMGYTGECRPRIFAARPAPVQVNYLGFPGTMGAPYMDYIVADRTVILEAQRRHYSEKIAYLPDTYLPADATRSISSRVMSRAAFGLPENGFVFCSFNNTYKFSPALFDVWMRLLTSIPESVLWLPESHPLAMRNLRQEAAARSVAAERIVFAAPVPASDEHLARLRLADLFLDTLPYNAHTTASDALWAGLPLLTCMGQSFAGRVAAGLLNAIGLPELVTRSLDEYEALALCLAREPMRLAAIREKLARNRETSPLFDTRRFVRNLESTLETMWRRAQRGEPPVDFVTGSPL